MARGISGLRPALFIASGRKLRETAQPLVGGSVRSILVASLESELEELAATIVVRRGSSPGALPPARRDPLHLVVGGLARG